MADIAIVALILLGAVIGFSKGFVLPLVAAGGALFTMAFLFAGPANGALPSGTAGLGVGAIALGVGATLFARVGMMIAGLIHRFGFLQRFAQGEMGMFATYIAWSLITNHGFS